ncbi:coiled-coil domain-containing protein 9 isoform X2 [Podarcis raffonei]|uniref:coiled-coil domain-containing protein 9 isoform X2 n=1 Tax=Podarcis raffonei TaxID=65483 RepID=UPI0023295276|nr:coiled-coil domain-containing protein 9 isoform X2 [Podarcis raffonei]
MSASLDLKSKEEKDAELDKRIEALRRKNQALIKRYQEIEEDRKKAEQEGIAVTGVHHCHPRSAEGEGPERRRGELDTPTLTVQVLLSPEEKRLVSSDRKPFRPGPGTPRGSVRGTPYPGPRSPRAEGPPEQPRWEGAGPDGPGASRRGGGRGARGQRARGRGAPAGDAGPDRRSKEWEERRRQNIEKMNEEMEKIAEYERSQRQDGAQEKNPIRNFLDDPRRSGAFAETDRREGSRRHVRNWGGADFEKVKTGMEQGKQWSPPGRGGARRRGVPVASPMDMTLSMTGRERAEYVRWKQEREQIDQERLARHRQPTGEWRREWDAQKMEAAFKEGAKPSGPSGGRHDEPRRPPKPPTFGQFLAEPQPERRRKGRGRGGGGRRGGGGAGPPKPYSMHDDRWEEQEEQPAPAADRAPEQQEAGRAAAQQAGAPASPSAGEKEEEEEEDQWEDVSEGEEEEAQGSGSQPEEEEEEEGPALAPRPPGRNGQLSLTMPAPQAETPSAEGKPLTPFSPAEGYCPVSDWGEEMELSSPRANPLKNPLAAPGEAPPPTAGMKPPDPPAEQGSPQAEGAAPPGPIAAPPAVAREEKEEEEDPQVVAAQEPGEPGAAMEQDPAAASGAVEITGFQREQTEEA